MRYTGQYLQDLQLALSIKGVGRLEGANILITGATGLIGSCIADLLLSLNSDHGYKTKVCLAGRSRNRVRDRFSHWGRNAFAFEEFDALCPNALQGGYDLIVHCASNAHPAVYAQEPVETAMANVVGTDFLLREIGRSHGRLLYVSSSEVYGEKPEAVPYREEDYLYVDILNPRASYPCSKRMAENLCASHAAEYGTDFVVARPGHVYGPTMTASDSRAHAQFARAAAAGDPVVMKSEGLQLRSYCYVIDCATALLTILLSGKRGEAYNISNSDSVVTVRQMAEAFAAAGDVDLVFELPTDVEEKGYNLMSCSALDSAKLESLGWRGRFDMCAGAARTLECMKRTV